MVCILSQSELVIKTTFGELFFGVTSKNGDLSNARIVSVNLEPMLPEGMQVIESIAILLRVNSSTEIQNLNFICTWNNTIEEGGSCSGEGLDAWEWWKDNHLLSIGTEDEEWLGSRLGTKYLSQSPVMMGNNGFEIHIEKYPKDKELSLHYIVSSNHFPEKKDCSCWYSVDVAHKRVLKACQ
jgi:hypothetical protein